MPRLDKLYRCGCGRKFFDEPDDGIKKFLFLSTYCDYHQSKIDEYERKKHVMSGQITILEHILGELKVKHELDLTHRFKIKKHFKYIN
jgi:hypothetical protein